MSQARKIYLGRCGCANGCIVQESALAYYYHTYRGWPPIDWITLESDPAAWFTSMGGDALTWRVPWEDYDTTTQLQDPSSLPYPGRMALCTDGTYGDALPNFRLRLTSKVLVTASYHAYTPGVGYGPKKTIQWRRTVVQEQEKWCAGGTHSDKIETLVGTQEDVHGWMGEMFLIIDGSHVAKEWDPPPSSPGTTKISATSTYVTLRRVRKWAVGTDHEASLQEDLEFTLDQVYYYADYQDDTQRLYNSLTLDDLLEEHTVNGHRVVTVRFDDAGSIVHDKGNVIQFATYCPPVTPWGAQPEPYYWWDWWPANPIDSNHPGNTVLGYQARNFYRGTYESGPEFTELQWEGTKVLLRIVPEYEPDTLGEDHDYYQRVWDHDMCTGGISAQTAEVLTLPGDGWLGIESDPNQVFTVYPQG